MSRDFSSATFPITSMSQNDISQDVKSKSRRGRQAVGAILLAGFLILVIKGVHLRATTQIYFIPSGAMENTLQIGDRIMVDKRSYISAAPKDGDIAVFTAPSAALLGQPVSGSVDFIKRVVGAPGEIVEIRKKKLLRNGQVVSEHFTKWDDQVYDLKIIGNQIYSRDYANGQAGPWTSNNIIAPDADQKLISHSAAGAVPPDCFVMLGDHRGNSNDSHVWGFAPRQAFIGKITNIFWPLNRRRQFN